MAKRQMQDATMRALARRGAEARIEELQRELQAIQALFPDLVGHRGRVIRNTPAIRKGGRKRRKMSAAARAAISAAQKARWAKQRKAEK